ncbi:MAG: DUF5320 domain-containing protein [Armatimonadota bacterium]|nr:DUF5320 domain-containing protein [Armatimonadota bacterium]
MRRRNMYYLTGLPGFVRFGYSPGWLGRSPSGLGPCAQFLLTGQWPLAQGMLGAGLWSGGAAAWPGIDPKARLEFLKSQAELLEQRLKALRDQIASLEEKEQ